MTLFILYFFPFGMNICIFFYVKHGIVHISKTNFWLNHEEESYILYDSCVVPIQLSNDLITLVLFWISLSRQQLFGQTTCGHRARQERALLYSLWVYSQWWPKNSMKLPLNKPVWRQTTYSLVTWISRTFSISFGFVMQYKDFVLI